MTRPLTYGNRVEVSLEAIQPTLDAAAKRLQDAAIEIADLRIAKARLEQEVHSLKARVEGYQQGREADERENKKLRSRLLAKRLKELEPMSNEEADQICREAGIDPVQSLAKAMRLVDAAEDRAKHPWLAEHYRLCRLVANDEDMTPIEFKLFVRLGELAALRRVARTGEGIAEIPEKIQEALGYGTCDPVSAWEQDGVRVLGSRTVHNGEVPASEVIKEVDKFGAVLLTVHGNLKYAQDQAMRLQAIRKPISQGQETP